MASVGPIEVRIKSKLVRDLAVLVDALLPFALRAVETDAMGDDAEVAVPVKTLRAALAALRHLDDSTAQSVCDAAAQCVD